jgi:DNA-binding NarL/FixJ family response regulator
MTNAEIAARLYISTKTVATRRQPVRQLSSAIERLPRSPPASAADIALS